MFPTDVKLLSVVLVLVVVVVLDPVCVGGLASAEAIHDPMGEIHLVVDRDLVEPGLLV